MMEKKVNGKRIRLEHDGNELQIRNKYGIHIGTLDYRYIYGDWIIKNKRGEIVSRGLDQGKVIEEFVEKAVR